MLISAVKSLDKMIKQYHSCMSILTLFCTFLSTVDPVGVFFYVLIAKKSTGVLGLAACRTLANLRSPRHCSNLRFPEKQDAR